MIKKRSSVKVQGEQPLNAIKACNTFSSANSLYGQFINTTFTYSVTERFVNQQKKVMKKTRKCLVTLRTSTP